MTSGTHFSVSHTPRRHLQRGVNLIEIMVAMAIGLFLVLGATTLYVNTKRTADVDDSIARLQETARYALSIIETDVRMANYWGLVKDSSRITNKESQGGAGTASGLSAGIADECGPTFIDPETYVGASNNNYNIACPANSTAVASADTLVVRRAAINCSSPSCPADNTRFQICSSRQEARLTLGADAACPANAEYHNLLVHGYYVDQQSDQSNNLPSLRRWSLIAGPGFTETEVIPGVEDMQIEFGWDNEGSDAFTSTPDAVRYVHPQDAVLTNAGGFPNGRVVAVRVWLLIRAEQQDATFTDDRTYEYGDRAAANGVVDDLNDAGADGAAYEPNDNFRRLLVSRTFFVRNVSGST